MIQHKTQGFTLVELVVVATILAILWAVWFVAYTWYISWARDANRIAQLASITDGLNVLTASSALPIPENKVDVIIGWEVIGYQWYAGENIIDTIWYQKGGKDPKDDTYFTYYLDSKRSSFQLMAFLEEEWATSFFREQAYANDYSSRIPTVYGQKLWALTDQFNTPVQEIDRIQSDGNINLSSTPTIYKAHKTNDDIIEWDSSVLTQIHPDTSCERIKEARWSAKSTYYTIHPNGDGIKYRIFCNMNGEVQNMLEENWELWTWSIWNYVRNWSTSEQSREILTTPLWVQDVVWRAIPDSTSGADGWWNYSDIRVDASKTYRVSVWVKKTGTRDGDTYLWTLRGQVANLSGSIDNNPYFWVWELPILDTWYLIVWYIYPYSHTSDDVAWGIYNTTQLEKVANTSRNFKFLPTTTVSRHRAYLFYVTDTSTWQQFYDPRFEEIPASKVGDVSDLLPVRVN